MSGQERLRYLENIATHRPYELELLRWNHDRQPHLQASDGALTDGCEHNGDGEHVDEADDRTAFEQLDCLTGKHRYTLNGTSIGGIRWEVLELAGVFLRSGESKLGALVWLPEAGPNFLIQESPDHPWLLVEVASLRKKRVIVDKLRRVTNAADATKDVSVSAMVSDLHKRHEKVQIRDADAHLTYPWLQAADDLRRIWSWDWRSLREGGSPFQVAQPKFVYTVNYPIGDIFRGLYGEARFQWRWAEDFQERGRLGITNLTWGEPTKLILEVDGSANFTELGGEMHHWGLASRCTS